MMQSCASPTKLRSGGPIPDTFRVLACLQQNRTRIRKVCLAVSELHGHNPGQRFVCDRSNSCGLRMFEMKESMLDRP